MTVVEIDTFCNMSAELSSWFI